GGFAEDLVGLTQLPVLPLQGLQPLRHIRGHAGALAAVDLGLLEPLIEGMGRAADLLGYRYDGRPAGWVIPAMLLHHAHRSGTNLRGKPVRSLACHAPSYSGVGASGKP